MNIFKNGSALGYYLEFLFKYLMSILTIIELERIFSTINYIGNKLRSRPLIKWVIIDLITNNLLCNILNVCNTNNIIHVYYLIVLINVMLKKIIKTVLNYNQLHKI